MTTEMPGDDASAPSLDELSDRADRTPRRLGHTEGGPTGESALPESAMRKAAAVKDEVQEQAVQAAEAVRGTAARAVRAARDHTPTEVLDRAGQVMAQAHEAVAHLGHLATDATPPQLRERAGRAATAARANRTQLLVLLGAAALAAAVLRAMNRRRR
ncbi:hypothetical protein ACGFX4_28145 [Kitasatospora sp. NPDC048365]|uniref:hypothetical protein n=1 Tax=Kitasatospora sp. NPDC048365 TaxID=3364050 RepID=UPI003723EC9F